MDREIKFRGKDIASNKWLFGDLRHHKDDMCIFEHGGNKGEQVKPETVGQFTGLKDKNGQEIYEGDVIKTAFDTRAFGVVTWNEDGYFFIDMDFGKHDNANCEYSTLGRMLRVQIDGKPIDIEIIGNIHENPELMKGGRQ